MRPTEMLRREHKTILRMLQTAEQEVAEIDQTGRVNSEELDAFLEFFADFVDRRHFAKEEKHLYTKLSERGGQHLQLPVQILLHDHAEGKRRMELVSEALPMAICGDLSALCAVRDNLAACVALLTSDMDKEERIIFPVADQLLPAECQELTEAFAGVDRDAGAGSSPLSSFPGSRGSDRAVRCADDNSGKV